MYLHFVIDGCLQTIKGTKAVQKYIKLLFPHHIILKQIIVIITVYPKHHDFKIQIRSSVGWWVKIWWVKMQRKRQFVCAQSNQCNVTIFSIGRAWTLTEN